MHRMHTQGTTAQGHHGDQDQNRDQDRDQDRDQVTDQDRDEDRDQVTDQDRDRDDDYPSVEELVHAARARLDRVTPRAAAREHAAGALLVDLRSEGRRRIDGEVPGSLVLERSVLEFRLDPCSRWRLEEAVDHQVRVILFCPLGQMSSLAAGALHDLGLRRATDLVGGFAAWREAGLPVVPGVTAPGSYVGSPASAIDLDFGAQRLVVDGTRVPLTQLEFRLVSELLRASGRVVSREELRACMGDWPGSRSRSVDLHVHRIRRKLGPRAAGLLTTEWGIGFRLRTVRSDGPHPYS